MQRTSRRSGFTVIELLVSIVVVAILLALLLPAVQYARESGRRAQCRNHLKQIGVAVESYNSLHGILPPGSSKGFSLHVFLLPHLDQTSLYEEVDFSGSSSDAVEITSRHIDVFHCPSDPVIPSRGTNYAGNFGSGVQRYGWNGAYRNLYSGWIEYGKGGPVRPAGITDGLSNTASVSETLIATGQPDELRTIWPVPTPFVGGALLDEFASACENLEPGATPLPDHWSRGRPWTEGNPGYTLYNHVLPPNRRSCKNETVADGAYPAASNHAGGVHVLYCDGRVQFVSDSVDRVIWRAIGSRNGGEAIESP